MMIFLNTSAGGGRAQHRWQSVASHEAIRGAGVILCTGILAETSRRIASAYATGERVFVGAGGDGTVNHLLNALVRALPEPLLRELCLGGIGLGSSNDFHKPHRIDSCINGIPCRIAWHDAPLHDACRLHIDDRPPDVDRYFLLNASAGMTAEANRFFNEPDAILRRLKRLSTPAAIGYAALRSILRLPDREITILDPPELRGVISMTNLGLIKSPHVSGSLRYGSTQHSDDGRLSCHIAHDMPTLERLLLLRNLLRGSIEDGPFHRSCTTTSLTFATREKMAIECDGEIEEGRTVRCTVVPHMIRVCT